MEILLLLEYFIFNGFIMKTKIVPIMFALLTVLSFAQVAMAEVINVTVNGMVCAFCAQGIKKNFLKMPGVTDVKPNLENKLVTIITKDEGALSNAAIKEIIKDAGYDVNGIEREKNE